MRCGKTVDTLDITEQRLELNEEHNSQYLGGKKRRVKGNVCSSHLRLLSVCQALCRLYKERCCEHRYAGRQGVSHIN